MEQNPSSDAEQIHREQEEPTMRLPKVCKENRYYYKNRESILEKRRLTRLAKKGIDITQSEDSIKNALEEKRKKKMELLGVTKDSK
jgi:hypothetical protein